MVGRVKCQHAHQRFHKEFVVDGCMFSDAPEVEISTSRSTCPKGELIERTYDCVIVSQLIERTYNNVIASPSLQGKTEDI